MAGITGVDSPSSAGAYDKYPALALDPAGTLWLAWASTRAGRDVIVARSRGASGWSAETRLDSGEGTESATAMALDRQNRPWVVWHGLRAGTWGVFVRRYDGRTWSAERRLADGLHPVAAVDTRGRVWVAWEVPRSNGFHGFDVEIAFFDQGRLSRPARIESPGSDRRPALAAAPDGGVWIAWDSTRSGNFDIWLARAQAGSGAPSIGEPVAVTRDGRVDDSPSLACARDGSLWVAWNSMRSHGSEPLRVDRHSGDAFVRVYRQGSWWTPPGVVPEALPGQVSYGLLNKTPNDAVPAYWQWKQTQNYPRVFLDARDRAWIVWRTDATGAHNFDLWARVHAGERWSPELHLTDFSPGRDEWPVAAARPEGSLELAWEGQVLPRPGDEAALGGGDVDSYNTLGNPNVVLVGNVTAPAEGWFPAPLSPASEEVVGDIGDNDEPMRPGPPPRTAKTRDGRWQIFFGDPHMHSILSDGKTGLPDQLLALARDPLGLDFAVVSDHAEMGRLQPTEFAEVRSTAATFDEPGRFVSLSGWEWTAGVRYGHRVILYRDDGAPPLSAMSPEGDTIEELHEYLHQTGGVMSPHHTGHATWGRWNPDAPHDDALEPNFEIASWHGRYEFYGNPWEGRRQIPGHQYQDALRRGRRVGVMGASDTHHLTPGEGGITAVLAERLDRASLFDAIRARRNYATTGARIVLDFTIDGEPMGSQIQAGDWINLSVAVEGTAAIDRVEIVRDLVDTFAVIRLEQVAGTPRGAFYIYDPADPQGGRRVPTEDLSRLEVKFEDAVKSTGETAYYVRVTQVDGHQAWSSPIWVSRRR